MEPSSQSGDQNNISHRTAEIHQKLLALLVKAGQQAESAGTHATRPVLMEWTENRLADFNLWITGTGALANPEASLDRRLAAYPEIKSIIVSLLGLLGSFIEDCHNPALHDQETDEVGNIVESDGSSSESSLGYFSPWSDEGSDPGMSAENQVHQMRIPGKNDSEGSEPILGLGDPLSGTLLESMQGAESILGQLIRFGFRIRQSATTARSLRADATFDAETHEAFRTHLTLMLSIPGYIGETSFEAHAKFSSKNQLPETELSIVQVRLIDANLKRRNRFIYAWNHVKTLAPQRTSEKKKNVTLSSSTPSKRPKTPGSQTANARRGGKSTVTPSKQNVEHETSRISGISGEGSQLINPTRPQTKSNRTGSTHVSSITRKMDYPSPPQTAKLDLLGFVCPCCAQVLPQKVAKSLGQWKNHLSQDVLPYICPLEDCQTPSIWYSSADDWKSHIHKDHTRTICWLCPACSETTETSSDFINHIRQNHDKIIDEELLGDFAETCRQSELVPITCPVCGDQGNCSLDVIGEHIHAFSLRSLPWPVADPPPDDLEPFQRSELPFQDEHYFADESTPAVSEDGVKRAKIDFDDLEPFDNEETETILQASRPEPEVSSAIKTPSEELRPEDFAVGWVCTLTTEMAAACAMLDEEYDMLDTQDPSDHNTYQLGRINQHKVVIACLSEYGTNSAAAVATDMPRTFQSIRFFLLVGIGAGIPSEDNDIRVGDVVIGDSGGTHGGVIQWDWSGPKTDVLGRAGTLDTPPRVLRTAVRDMRSHHLLAEDKIAVTIETALQRYPRLRNKFFFQGSEHDALDRSSRDNEDPFIHYGIIASSNQVVKDEQTRDKLGRDFGAICIDMEAAGFMNDFPCLVIRGISDYADSKKDDRWQPYAAMTAAACAKELLGFVSEQDLSHTPDVSQMLNAITEHVDSRDRSGANLLARARANKNAEMISLLLRYGADLGEDGNALLYEAAAAGWTTRAQFLLEHGVKIKGPSEEDHSELYLAAKSGSLEMVRLLLDHGADVSRNDFALLKAVEAGHTYIVHLLLDAGAVVDAADFEGTTPLGEAAAGGYTEMIQMLIRSGANVNATNEDGLTPLKLAIKGGRTAAVKLLLEYGADVQMDLTALELAVELMHPDIVSLLLDHVGPMGKADGGRKYLQAISRASTDYVSENAIRVLGLLLENGADPKWLEPADFWDNYITGNESDGYRIKYIPSDRLPNSRDSTESETESDPSEAAERQNSYDSDSSDASEEISHELTSASVKQIGSGGDIGAWLEALEDQSS